MKRLFALLPAAGLAAASLLAVTALVSTDAAAQACRVDSTDGSCVNDGAKCTDANGKAGRCKTLQPGVREYTCVCAVKKGPGGRSERPNRPDREPTEEPMEEEPE